MHETSLNVSDSRYERAMPRRNTVKQLQEDQECSNETMVEEQTTDSEPQPEQDINDNEIQQTTKTTTGMCIIKSGQHCSTKREGKDANKTTTARNVRSKTKTTLLYEQRRRRCVQKIKKCRKSRTKGMF